MALGASGHIEDLRGVAWARRPYRQWTRAWDHDHCEVCNVGFSESGLEDLREGFATTSAFEFGAEYCWVCSPCFERCRDELEWEVVTDARLSDRLTAHPTLGRRCGRNRACTTPSRARFCPRGARRSAHATELLVV